MVVPNVYKFAAFGACAVVSDLDSCIIFDVEWRRSRLGEEGVVEDASKSIGFLDCGCGGGVLCFARG